VWCVCGVVRVSVCVVCVCVCSLCVCVVTRQGQGAGLATLEEPPCIHFMNCIHDMEQAEANLRVQ